MPNINLTIPLLTLPILLSLLTSCTCSRNNNTGHNAYINGTFTTGCIKNTSNITSKKNNFTPYSSISILTITDSKMFLSTTKYHSTGSIPYCLKDNLVSKIDEEFDIRNTGIHKGARIIELKYISLKYTPLTDRITEKCNSDPKNCEGVTNLVTGQPKELIDVLVKPENKISYITLDLNYDGSTLYMNDYNPKHWFNPSVRKGKNVGVFKRQKIYKDHEGIFATGCVKEKGEKRDKYPTSSTIVIEGSKMFRSTTMYYDNGSKSRCRNKDALSRTEAEYDIKEVGTHKGARIIKRKFTSFRYTPLRDDVTKNCNLNPKDCEGMTGWVTGESKEIIDKINANESGISYITLDFDEDGLRIYTNKYQPGMSEFNPSVVEGEVAEVFKRKMSFGEIEGKFGTGCIKDKKDSRSETLSTMVFKDSKMFHSTTVYHNTSSKPKCKDKHALFRIEAEYNTKDVGIYRGARIVERNVLSYRYTPLHRAITKYCNSDPKNCDGITDWVTGQTRELIDVIKAKESGTGYITVDIDNGGTVLYTNQYKPDLLNSNPNARDGEISEVFQKKDHGEEIFFLWWLFTFWL